MLDGASPGSGKYQAQTVSAPQHFQSEDGYPAVSGSFSIRLGSVACSASNFSICASSFSGFGRAFTPSSFRASLLVM